MEHHGSPHKYYEYLDIFRKAMKFSERRTIVAAGKVMFFQEAVGLVSMAEWVARELESILNVTTCIFCG